MSQDCNAFVNKSEPKCPKRFTLHVHQRVVTSLVWSKNSMKLFSGDEEGNVYLIEIDYEKSECTGRLLLQVNSRIVQLSYTHQKLAVSYLERCLIYDVRNQMKVVVGKKPRNPPGMFGCCFSSSLENPQEDILYCARPNRKIWSANSEGEVLFSYIHQKIPESSNITLIDSSQISPNNNKVEFGKLYDYRQSILISHTESCIIVLNVSSQKVLVFCSDFQKICDIAVSGDYVFILDNHRKIICLSPFKPSFGCEGRNMTTSSNRNPLMSSVHFPLQDNLNFESLYDIKAKMPFLDKKLGLLDNITKFGETVASKISEIATPPIIAGSKDENLEGNKNGDEVHMPSVRMPKPYFIGMATGAAFHSHHHQNKNEKAFEEKNSSLSGDLLEPMTLEAEYEIEEKKNTSVIVLPKEKKKLKKKPEIVAILDMPHDIKKVREFNNDSRTYEDFKETIEENESLLAEVLNLSCLKMDHENKKSEETYEEDSEHQNISDDSLPYLSCENSLFSNSLSDFEQNNLSINNLGKELAYGPPSGSSATHSSLDEGGFLSCGPFIFKEETFTSGLQSEEVNTMPPPEELPWDWHRHHLPAKPETLIGHKNSICLTESKSFYFSHDFYLDNEKLSRWKRRKLQETIKSFSSSETELFVLSAQGSVFSVDWKDFTESKSILYQDRSVASISLDEDILWTLNKNGKVHCRNLRVRDSSSVEISCLELRLKSVVCRSGVVWALTHNGRIAYRIGVRPNVPFGLEWGIILHPYKVKCIHLSENGLGWMFDEKGNLYVKLYVSQSFPQGIDGNWWQMGMADYMFGSVNCEERMLTTLTEEENYNRILMTSNEQFLWLSEVDSPFAFVHSLRSFTGHRWDRLNTEKFTSICGEGIFKSYGILYCLDTNGLLFAVNAHSDQIVPIDLPNQEKLVSISTRPESLWAVTISGKIFIRTGLSGTSVFGLKWVELDLQQIADVKFHHISLSTEVVWAVDVDGQIYIRQGPLSAPDPKRKGLDPAWLHVDSVELQNCTFFKKVYVGNKSHMVWAIDSNFRVYVREAIFPELSTGTSWVMLSGIRAQSLSISEDLVYAVTPCSEDDTYGTLYVREGITSTNYIGNSWKRIPTHSLEFQDITASVDNCIWGLEKDGTIFKHVKLSLFDIEIDGKLPPVVGDEEVSGL